MALQHFFSRVPAKMSMFNRTDGPDTFACSEELERSFIDKELVTVCEFKPTMTEAALVRNDKLPPVYFQGYTKDRVYFQTCMNFLPLDFTGERSTFMSHSLVFSKEEEKKVTSNPDKAVFNKAMFEDDIGKFDITNRDGEPIENFPEKVYEQTAPTGNIELITRNPELGKRFMYAVLQAICGNCKNLIFDMPVKIEELSNSALDLLNNVAQVIPYNLRPYMTFVTYVGEYNKYNSFRIKCVPQDVQGKVANKQIYISLGQVLVTGIKDSEFIQAEVLVNFFMKLFQDDLLRRDFLEFYDHVVTNMPEADINSWKVLNDIVFLFRQASGSFPEQRVLPNDDTVVEYIATYDKYRHAMPTESRISALRCLRRYPELHMAIPPKAFTKIQKMYKTEPTGAKHVMMAVSLDLIHTELMRDKLFAFIKANYENEDPGEKETIISNIIRVFYGGFLQNEIIDFFAEHFAGEPAEVQDDIVDKLLLAIRTKEISGSIISFIKKNYDNFSENSQKRFFDTLLVVIPDGDNTAMELISIADAKMEDLSEDFKNDLSERLCEVLDKEQKKREHRVLAAIFTEETFVFDATVKKLFGEWSNKKIFDEFITAITSGSRLKLVKIVKRVFEIEPDMQKDVAVKFAEKLGENIREGIPEKDVVSLISEEKALKNKLKKVGTPATLYFAEYWENNIAKKVINSSLTNVFNENSTPNMAEFVVNYIENHDVELNEDQKTDSIYDYLELKKNIKKEHFEKAKIAYDKLPTDKKQRVQLGKYMKNDFEIELDVGTEAIVVAKAIVNILIDGNPAFGKIYDELIGCHEDEDYDRDLMAYNDLVTAVSTLADTFKIDSAKTDSCGLGDAVQKFTEKYKEPAVKACKEQQKFFKSVSPSTAKLIAGGLKRGKPANPVSSVFSGIGDKASEITRKLFKR